MLYRKPFVGHVFFYVYGNGYPIGRNEPFSGCIVYLDRIQPESEMWESGENRDIRVLDVETSVQIFR